ncbi:cytidine deaminase [Isachenkonia alkalipeptolytica]|uniref:Cytidine deaminase n=1 Tax=Isachenkonia alkalipeptolytica TaxID=2565777 RepID=A0AA43XM98_9CLOT|nr:cytidine deaminase [Isachenkonia alkalipeptolytica]NBG89320.1 cytidine deaminase [Isachenkonia alkalipeptolytica]
MTNKELIRKALEAQKMAYVPYSEFPVGAAVLTSTGKVFTGCNIENASFGATNCAERTALFKAISEGEKDFKTIAIVGDPEAFTAPCGICRQVLVEFGLDITVILAKSEEEYQTYTMEEILPLSFTPKDLENKGGTV